VTAFFENVVNWKFAASNLDRAERRKAAE